VLPLVALAVRLVLQLGVFLKLLQQAREDDRAVVGAVQRDTVFLARVDEVVFLRAGDGVAFGLRDDLHARADPRRVAGTRSR
jgi:ABC-type protease/lipase transport system fused ATPase/permease subunit